MFSSLPIISIELNNSYVKVVEAKRKGDALKILAYKEMDVKNVNVVSEVYNELDILAALNDYLVGKDVSKYEVNIVISGVAKLLVREVVIPKLPQRKIYNLLKMEANQYFPVNLENYVIDYKIIEEFKENNAKKLKILVFAVSRYVIEQIINIAKMLKLKVNRIDLEPNALSKFILRSGIGRRETAMIVNLERSFITSVITKNGVIQLTKTYPYNNKDLYRQRHNPNYIIDEFKFNEIIENISKLAEFYRIKERGDIKNIYLTGEFAEHFNMHKKIEERTGITTTIMDKFDFALGIDGDKALDFISPISSLL